MGADVWPLSDTLEHLGVQHGRLLLAQSGHHDRAKECPLSGGGFNRSTQHLLILVEEEVCDGGDCTDMAHAAAEG
jgi:hypothetical protein